MVIEINLSKEQVIKIKKHLAKSEKDYNKISNYAVLNYVQALADEAAETPEKFAVHS